MKKHTVSLVLGGGGARGLAHIGVIESLVKNDFEIRSIAGTSMGALIGGIYAMGKLDVYTGWVTALKKRDVIRLLDLSFALDGLFKGERIIDVLKKLIGESIIEDLPIAYTAVATDLESGKEVWLDHGPLFDAIRASMAIPGVFASHSHQGKQLLDGGLVNPVPIMPTLKDKTDLTIAVNINARPGQQVRIKESPQAQDEQQLSNYRQRIIQFIDSLKQHIELRSSGTLSMFEVIVKSKEIMENTLTQVQLEKCAPDILIEIPRNICGFHEFYRASELIEVGRQCADEVVSKYFKKNGLPD